MPFTFVLLKRFFLVGILLTTASILARGERVRVPIGGNAWVKEGSQEKITREGLTQWAESKATIDTYVRFFKAGKVKVYLEAQLSGRSRIAVTINNHTYQKTIREKEGDEHYLGEWSIPEPGYVKIELRGLSRSATYFAKPTAWLLEGDSVLDSLAFVRSPEDNYFYWGRRGPSVHLMYPVPDDSQVEWFYNEVTVPENQDVIGSYYMANGFAEGYFGMQVNSATERRILFSVWSPFRTDDPNSIPDDQKIRLLRKGEGVFTGEFGNEGAGGQSYLKYPWQAGQTYRFLLQGKPTGEGTTTYTAYFYAPEEAHWRLIASFVRPATSTYLKRLHSFLENFIPETGNLPREVQFGNQWLVTADGEWRELTNARFSADATARKGFRMDYAGGSRSNFFYLRNCGFFNTYTNIGSQFMRIENTRRPDIDFTKFP